MKPTGFIRPEVDFAVPLTPGMRMRTQDSELN